MARPEDSEGQGSESREIDVTTTAPDGTVHTTRVLVFDLGDATVPARTDVSS